MLKQSLQRCDWVTPTFIFQRHLSQLTDEQHTRIVTRTAFLFLTLTVHRDSALWTRHRGIAISQPRAPPPEQ